MDGGRGRTSAAADMNLQVIVSQNGTLHTSRRNFVLLTLVLIYRLTLMYGLSIAGASPRKKLAVACEKRDLKST